MPDETWLADWAQNNGKTAALYVLGNDKDLHQALDGAVSRINQRLSNIEKIRRFIIADAPFMIDNALMTPTMKIRRHKINEQVTAQALVALGLILIGIAIASYRMKPLTPPV